MDASVHRRVVDRHAAATAAANRTGLLLARSTSNLSSSSTSSDILVASANPSTNHPRPTQPASNMRVTAHVGVGGRIEFRGIPYAFLQRLEASENLDPRDRPHEHAGSPSMPIGSLTDNRTAYNDDDDGPNHKGTYSKAYTLKHPEIKWVHRGQGRYLPSNTVPYQDPRTHSGYKPSSKTTHSPRFAGRLSLRGRSGDVDAETDVDEGDDEDDPPFHSQHSHASKRLSDASYSLRRRASEVDPTTPGESRAARHHRRSGQFADFDDDTPAEDESEPEDEGAKTYSKEYKDAHPEFDWRHTGNGRYKIGPKPSITPVTYSTRRDSNRSQVEPQVEPTGGKRYRKEKFHLLFPNEIPVYVKNGWWRRSSPTEGAADQSAIETSDEEDVAMKDGKFSKEEMVNYVNTHPGAQFVHRGNGRYVLTDEIGTIVTTPAPQRSTEEPGQTFSKAYVQAHPNESFFHAGSGRYRRGSRPTRQSDVSRKSDLPSFEEDVKEPAIPSTLVNKEFVNAHPEMEFHHRGQGRYAYGPRPVESPATAAPAAPVAEPKPSPAISEPELVDTAYVEAHPHETFHHRGQGRWARGLPPPGSSNKTAVRGPMASQAKFSATPSNPPPEPLPGLNELLIRSEGPDKYPQLDWVYRGGGKWCRTPKKKEPVATKSSRPRISRGKGFNRSQEMHDDSDDSQEVVYTDDEYAAAMGGGSFQETPNESRRQSLTNGDLRVDTGISRRQRKYLQQQDLDEVSRQTSKNSSQKSKTATPKPQRLTLEDDKLEDEDNYPSLYASAWPPPRTDEPFDEAAKLMRKIYKPLNQPDVFVNALTRKDPATRPKEVLQATTSYVQKLLQQLQDEYLELDKITAPHARVPRRPVKGGRVPQEYATYEDKKEADLYDYTFDARKVGYQNPESQKIIRDAEGRALRKRRQRNALDVDPAATTGGEDAPLGPRRAVKPVSRFDGIDPGPTRRKRTNNGTVKPAASMTPDPATAPPAPQVLPGGYVVRKTGRWKNHIPKRIRELRGDSVGGTAPTNNGAASPGVEEGANRSETPGTSSDTPGPNIDGKEGSPGVVRKGRPKGSKNLHKRRDAGIPKGPRKPKVMAVPSIEGSSAAAGPAPAPGTGNNSSAMMSFGGGGGSLGGSTNPSAGASRDERNDPWSRNIFF